MLSIIIDNSSTDGYADSLYIFLILHFAWTLYIRPLYIFVVSYFSWILYIAKILTILIILYNLYLLSPYITTLCTGIIIGYASYDTIYECTMILVYRDKYLLDPLEDQKN